MSLSPGIKVLAAGMLLVAASCLAPPAQAAEHESALWLGTSYTGPLGDGPEWSRWRYRAQLQARGFEALDGARQAIIGLGLIYRLPNSFSISGGYRYFHTQFDGAGSVHEQRLWQELNWTTGGWWGGTLRSRTRLEQRYLQERSGTGLRLRQQFRLDVPLADFQGLDLVSGVESLFQLRDTSWTQAGYAETRAFIGFNKAVSPKLQIDIGYVHQRVRREQAPDFVNHILVANFNFR